MTLGSPRTTIINNDTTSKDAPETRPTELELMLR